MGNAWHDPGIEQGPSAWGGVAGTAQCNLASADLGSLISAVGVSKRQARVGRWFKALQISLAVIGSHCGTKSSI